MRSFKRSWAGPSALALGVGLLLAMSTAAQQPRADIVAFTQWLRSVPDPVLVRYWMRRDCDVGEQGVLTAELEARGARLEPPFLQAFSSDRPDLARQEVLARMRFAEVRKRLAEGATFGLDAADLAQLQQENVDDYVARALARARRAWRGASIGALGLVGTKVTLDALAQDDWSQDPDRELIARAVAQIQDRIQ